ncbi:M4 family metallopeptidase [Pelomonas sp. V22]|uniref:M4 family metallopeptidase n=1 Tax=Pelomonas sp. V22 TaxID=2822139 RepID=UPI0024A93422|nr:M4 family metallopeptidase [Pelomonas sp. V22]MDI4631787.1 M4 family metallopeptidase [Pelomonas sp. V22]
MKARRSPALSSICLALLTLALAPLSAHADKANAEGKALGHIKNFPGHSLDDNDQAYSLRDIVIDADGSEHVRLDRRYKGLRVIGGDLIVRSDRNGTLVEMRRTLTRAPKAELKPAIKQGQALQAAKAALGGDANGQSPELVIYARGDMPVLAWDVLVVGEEADGTPFEKHGIVSADTGNLLDVWNDVHTAAATGTGKSLYSGNVVLTTNTVTGGYELRDPSRGSTYTINLNKKTNGGSVLTDADNIWGNNLTSDAASAAVDAQYGTAMTWDYYKNVHGRNGIANDGKGAYNRVHYGRNYANAYWSDSCFCMTYGDGDGTSLRPLVSLDVAGHEMTHGVTSRSANLTYSGESGGLNEATSDIFGTMVEFYANNANDAGDYLIGEKVMIKSAFLRSMMKPSSDGGSSDCWYSGVGSLDVHYSSGVANHWFFLLAEGTNSSFGSSPTCVAGNTRVATGSGSLAGIGRDAAAKIWYRALTVKMTSNTNYAGARAASISAANDLYGAGSTQASAVAAAWSAVGVN